MTTIRTADFPQLVEIADATARLKKIQPVQRHTLIRENGQLTRSIEALSWEPEDPRPLIDAGLRAARDFKAVNDDQRVLAAALAADLAAAGARFAPGLAKAHADLRRLLREAAVVDV